MPRLRLPFAALGVLLALFTLLRVALSVLFPSPTPIAGTDWARLFLVGFHLDLVAGVVLTLPLACWCALAPVRIWRSPWHARLLVAGLFSAWSVLVFLLVAEGFFFEEFQSRYNPVAIDYLIYPHEVFVNLWQSYPLVRVVALCVAAGAVLAWLCRRGMEAHRESSASWRAAAGWSLAALLLAVSARGTGSQFSRDRVVNELANNTFRSLLTAALTRNLDYRAFYPTLPRDEAFALARKLVIGQHHVPTGSAESLQRLVPGDLARPKLNVILLLEESLGSEFWGCLGRPGESLTPRLDDLAKKDGLLFENVYADGNRTIRGYEGVYCSFPPLPGDSIVARDRTENVETLAQVFNRDAYETMFLYAGRGVFDGTGAFARGNGWKHFLELKDFRNPAFTSAWGVCNEDLYDRAIEEMRQFHKAGRPFFITTMSVSNHKPYTYPKGRIAEDPAARSRAHVVKYSDFALGRFFEMARREPFWTNTIFAVVADHGARVYGSQTIPIHSYEIPMLVVGPAVVKQPARNTTLGCQLDVGPTLLGLIGRPYETTFFGHDLLREPELAGRVLLHHNRSVGIYSDQRLVIFNLNKHVEYFAGDAKKETLRRMKEPDDRARQLEREATALYQVGDALYMERRYQVQPGRQKL